MEIEKNKKVDSKCPSCCSERLEYICEYKHLMKGDEQYLGDMKLVQCINCELVFACPFPSVSELDRYYKEVYRKQGHPHFVKDPHKTDPGVWQKAQTAYINQFIDFKEISHVADFGPGYGFLLREIRSSYPQLKLTALDPDKTSLAYLRNYNINLKDPLEKDSFQRDAGNKYDLVISSHSLEHMTDPIQFFESIKNLLTADGRLFLEVPNAPFKKDEFTKLAYHGPHLLFFNLKSLVRAIEHCDLKIINITTAGPGISWLLDAMSDTYQSFNHPSHSLKKKISGCFRSFLPARMKKIIKAIVGVNAEEKNCIPEFCKYGGDRWTIRCMVRENKQEKIKI